MSGMEIVGLLLGVLGVLEPVEETCRALSGVCRKSKSFAYFITSSRKRLQIEGRKFQKTTSTLLQSIDFGADLLDLESLIELGQSGLNDPRWQNPDCQEQLRRHLKNYPEVPAAIELVLGGFYEINRSFRKLSLATKAKDVTEDFEFDNLDLRKEDQAKKLSPKQKYKLSRAKQDDLDKLMDRVQKDVESYRSAVKQYSTDQHGRSGYQEACISPERRADAASAWKTVTSAFEMLNSFSSRLFEALHASGSCSCHAVGLRLDFEILLRYNKGRHQIQRPFLPDLNDLYKRFELLAIIDHGDVFESVNITHANGRTLFQDLLPLEVKMRQIAKPQQSKGTLTPKKNIKNTAEPVAGLVTQAKAKRGVRFVEKIQCIRTLKVPRIAGSMSSSSKITEIDIDPSESPHDTSSHQEAGSVDLNIRKIVSLCNCLSGAMKGTKSSASCLGYIDFDGDEKVHYLLYHRQIQSPWSPIPTTHDPPIHTKQTLHEILSSSRKDLRLSVQDRMKLAYTLASSLLQLHSSPWIAEVWRSRDILLVRDQSLSKSTGCSEWSPYVTKKSQTTQDDHSMEGIQLERSYSDLATRTYIYSLGIALMEIGLSAPLLSYSSTRGKIENETTVFSNSFSTAECERENNAALKVVKESAVASEMGPQYQNVVNHCIYWKQRHNNLDFNLTDDKLRRIFYEEIVWELRICLTPWEKKVNGDTWA